MGNFFSDNYWAVGFQSSLYDRLSPESYFDSMRKVVANLPEGKSLRLLDAGCGSGLLLRFLHDRIRAGMSYTGIEMLKSGVAQTLSRAEGLEVSCYQADLTLPLPVDGGKFDIVVAHFSLYTLVPSEKRLLALENLKAVMKEEGILIIVNPSVNYDARSIIEHSIQLVRQSRGLLMSQIKKYLVYPLTRAIGLRFIQKQLKSGKWQAYSRELFIQEIESVGFKVHYVEEVYAGGAFLGIGKLV